MNINDNGIVRDMTPEEIAEMERLQSELPPPAPSLEETVEQQKQEIAELREALNALLERRVQ